MFSLAWLGEVASLIQTLIVSAAGIAGLWGINAWRRQLVGKRKAELAEVALTAIYEARDVFKWVRTGAFHTGEGESRKAEDGEGEQVRAMRNTYFIPIERLHREKELFSRLHAQRYQFRAYFGDDAAKPFDAISKVHNDLIITSSVLVRQAQFDGASRAVASARDNLLDDLGWGRRERPDDMDRLIDKAVANIEATCKPILEGRSA